MTAQRDAQGRFIAGTGGGRTSSGGSVPGVRVVDHGADALLKRLEAAASVRVGILGSLAGAAKAGDETGGLTVAEVAEANEFGLGVPRRSFIRDYIDQAEPHLRSMLERVAQEVERGRPLESALETFGLVVVGEIKERISAGIPPPNSPLTIALKGSSTPLIDTGQLRSSITHVVEKGAGGGNA